MPLGPETASLTEPPNTIKTLKMAKCFDKELRLELRLEWNVASYDPTG